MTYKVDKAFMDQVQDELSNYMDDLYDYRTDYSGRAMYGDKCIAFVHDEMDARFAMALVLSVRQVAEDHPKIENELLTMARGEDWWQLLRILGNGRSDSMGTNTITYFPEIQFEGEVD